MFIKSMHRYLAPEGEGGSGGGAETMEVELLSGAKVTLPKEQALKEIEQRQKYKNELRKRDEELGQIKQEKETQLAAAKKAQEDAEAQAAIKAGELDKAKEIYERQASEKINKIEKAFRSSRLESLVRSNATIIPEAAGDIASQLASSCRYDLESESLQVIGADGKPRVDQNGKPLSVDALIAEFTDARPYLRKAVTPGGSGAAGGAGNKGPAKTMLRSEWENLPGKAKAEFFKTGGTLRDS